MARIVARKAVGKPGQGFWASIHHRSHQLFSFYFARLLAADAYKCSTPYMHILPIYKDVCIIGRRYYAGDTAAEVIPTSLFLGQVRVFGTLPLFRFGRSYGISEC